MLSPVVLTNYYLYPYRMRNITLLLVLICLTAGAISFFGKWYAALVVIAVVAGFAVLFKAAWRMHKIRQMVSRVDF